MPDRWNGGIADQGILSIKNAKIGQTKGKFDCATGIHANIVHHGTDNSAGL
jgi:hypothetical protein